MSIKKTTVLMAAVLALATVLAAGLAVLPSSVQDAQANPCSELSQAVSGNTEVFTEGEADADEQNTDAAAVIECDLTGVVINEQVTTTDPFAATEEGTEEEAEDAEFE